MSEVDKEQKTEEATDKRRADLRKEGKVAQSHDLISAATLIAACAALFATLDNVDRSLRSLVLQALRVHESASPALVLRSTLSVVGAIAPAIFAASIAAVAAGLAQTRGLFSLSLAFPKLERLDPLGRLKNLFPSPQMALETGKSLFKIALIALVMKVLLTQELHRLLMLSTEDSRVAAGEVGSIAVRVVLWAGAAFMVIAAVDFTIALRKFQKDAMMSRQEIKEEFKQEEQDPNLKRKMRMRGRELLMQRSAGGVDSATVLVTNPTHVAVALRYEPGQDGAPIVVGKALEDAALSMRAAARKRGIPIVENRPLARALHKTTKVGRPVPVELYGGVAEVIAHVLKLRSGMKS